MQALDKTLQDKAITNFTSVLAVLDEVKKGTIDHAIFNAIHQNLDGNSASAAQVCLTCL